jgi:uncharacterized membrane protein
MSIATKTRTGLAGAAALIALASLSAPSFAAEKVKEEPSRCYGINTCRAPACAPPPRTTAKA